MRPVKSLSRRQLLKLSASALLSASIWPGALQAADAAAGEFQFFVINDLHLVDRNCLPYFEKVIRSLQAARQKPDFCIIAGDLSDGGTAEQLAMVRDLFALLKMHIQVVCGNHDYRTNDDREPFMDMYGKSINYTFEHKGWQFVAPDTTHGLRATVTIQKPAFDFLDAALPKLDRRKPTLIFTHFPLGPNVPMRPTNAEELLNRMKEYNLRAVFGGHHHGFTERKMNEIVLTTNRCCSFRRDNHDGTKEKGYFVCQAKDGQITREFVEVKPD